MQPHRMPWNTLPTEMKISIVEILDLKDVRAFAEVNKEAYSLSVPTMWKFVELGSVQALHSYIRNVPLPYHRYIRQLSVCTKSKDPVAPPHSTQAVTEALVQLLSHCVQVERLSLNLEGSLTKAVIPFFGSLHSLRALSIQHCGDERKTPLSERLVVSIAASVPSLADLSLDRVSRSAMHAPELIGAYPFVPVVSGDDDVPAHPLLGSELCLPSLLRLPTLKKLRIRDTHLGDPRWSVTPARCSLEVLDLGSCYHETSDFNRICTERIIGNVGDTVNEFSLNTAITTDTFAFSKPKETPLKMLRKIHLTPLFPVDNVVDTLETLSGSPVEELSVRCHEDDVEDMCCALEDFLSLRVERGESDFYHNLSKINFDTVTDICDTVAPEGNGSFRGRSVTLPAEQALALKHLQDFCQDLRLPTTVSSADPCSPGSTGGSPGGKAMGTTPTPGRVEHANNPVAVR